MAIDKLVPPIAQVSDTHIDTCKFCKQANKNCAYIQNNDLKWLEEISDFIHVNFN